MERPIPWLLLWVCGGLPPAETLKVQMSTKPMMFFLNTNISIPCLISEYSTPQLDINSMRITWYLKTQDTDQEKMLFTFIAGNHRPFRVGSYMLESEIKKGNAALFVTQIQLEETGLYRCQVTVTPDDAQGTASLEVVAQPSVSLYPNEVIVESGKEKTLTCGVKKYYPHSLDIMWIKISKNNQITTVREDICIEASVENDDGTFNSSSKLRVQPSLQDNGNVYRCVVNHRSLTDSILLDATLTVTAPKLDISTLVGSVIASIVACLLLGLIAFLYIKLYNPLPPKIIPFRGSLEMKHLEETVLTYHIMGFRPKPITINFYLKYPQERKVKIFSWASVQCDAGREEVIPLKDQKDQKAFKFQMHVEKEKNGTFTVPCTLHVSPNAREHNKAELSVEVIHDTLKSHPLEQTTPLNVIAPIVLDSVQCSTDKPTAEESFTLTCRAHSFFPETIELHWYKDEEQLSEGTFTSVVTKGSDGLFFCNSVLEVIPSIEDFGKRFVCKAKLKGSHHYKDSAWQLENMVCKPQISEIVCTPQIPEYGKPITLSCTVTSFFPACCQIYWMRGFERFTAAEVKTQGPWLMATKLYYKESQVTFTPKQEDHAAQFTVEVAHCSSTTRKSYSLNLKGFPKVTDIVLSPSEPEYGEPLSLLCKVSDFCPEDTKFQWLLEEEVIKQELLHNSSNSLPLNSVLQITPTASMFGKKISFKVMYEALEKPITKDIFLRLPAKSPVVSEIRKIPSQTIANKTACLEVFISNFVPKDIRIIWYKDWTELSETNQVTKTEIGQNGLYFCMSKLQVSTKASENIKVIRCEVIHPATQCCVERAFPLSPAAGFKKAANKPRLTANGCHTEPLKNSSPRQEAATTLKIKCVTEHPQAGEDVTFQCCAPGRNRGSVVFVAWFKDLFPIEEEVKNADCEDGSGFISCVTFKTEKQSKECRIRCEVSTEDETFEETYVLKLD